MCFGPELAAAAETVGEAATAAAPYATAASTAAQLAGSYSRSRAQNAQNQAQAAALEQQREKQHALQTEANQAIVGTANAYDPTTQQPQLAALQAQRTAAEAPAPMPTQGYQTITSSAPKVVQSDQERKMAEALTQGKTEATRSGNLQGYGDTDLANRIRLGRAGQQVGQIENFSRGESNVLPLQLESAYNKGGNWMEAADIADALGRVGSLYAMTRGKKPGIGYGAAGTAAGTSMAPDAAGNMVGVL